MAGQPKPAFYTALAAVVLGLLAYAVYRADLFAPQGADPQGKKSAPIRPENLKPPAAQPADGKAAVALGQESEAADPSTLTTVKEYKYVPAQRLPPVKGTSAYKAMQNDTLRFALNVWAGWGPIILANEGFKPGKTWKTPDGKDFRVELVLIDDPVAMRQAYAAGEIHIGWGTLDMVPLLVDSLVRTKDSRVMPRIYQQIDWSNGGDGIVVRENIRTVADLRGKQLVLAHNSPSEYFALNMLVSGGVQPSEVNMVFTQTAFEAAAAFAREKSLSGVVSWAPDIYNLAKVRGNRMLVNTQTANKLIADVWFARADFAKDHPAIIEGLVRGIFDSMEQMKSQDAQQRCAKLMADGYNIPAADALAMFGDAHNTNWAENYQFFMNQNNPTNFERVWQQAYYLYRRVGRIENTPVKFDEVMDFSVIAKLGNEEKYKSQKDEYQIQLAPRTVSEIQAESNEILTNTIFIRFFPNSWDLHKKVAKTVDGKDVEELYDPAVDVTLEQIARVTEQFGAARVIIEGHSDSSMKGRVPATLAKELSSNRAAAVKEALVSKFKLDPNKFATAGMGWDRPADPNKPDDHAMNRRVEVKVYPAEQQ